MGYVDAASGKKGTLHSYGILVHTGLDANTEFLSDILSLGDIERVPVDESMETEIPLIYAIGDVRSGSPGQVSTTTGDGDAAAISAIRQLQNR